MDRDLISPVPMPDLGPEDPDLEEAPRPVPPQQPITVESLLQHIRTLTDNQNELIGQIRNMKSKAEDPFLQFRTPDPIKNLATFSGNKKETHAWLEDAENTLALFNAYTNQPIYSQLVRAVKNKIIGDAKEILIAAGNPNNWDQIKEIILNSYGDRRDLTSHIQSLFYINQGKRTLTEFYNQVKKIDTSIKATAALMDDYKASTKAINSLISLMSLTRFVDGLNDELSMHVRSYRPQSLEDAYSITMQYSNAAYRQKLNKQTTDVKTTKSNTFRNEYTSMKNTNNFEKKITPHTSQSQTPLNRNHQNSDKWRVSKQTNDGDVSMRTVQSRQQINNNQTTDETEKDTKTDDVDASLLESDDDDYFLDDELNFQVVDGKHQTG